MSSLSIELSGSSGCQLEGNRNGDRHLHFAENSPDPQTGAVISASQRLRNLLDEIELADQVGLDVFGVGEQSARSTVPCWWAAPRN